MADTSSIASRLVVFIDPCGRIRRVPFLLTQLTVYVALAVCAIKSAHLPRTEGIDPVRVSVQILLMSLFWPKFCLTARRLHDVGLSSWLAAPYPVIVGCFLSSYLPQTWYISLILWLYSHYLPLPPTPNFALTGGLSVVASMLGELVLVFVPGSKGDNRYGASEGKPAPLSDAF